MGEISMTVIPRTASAEDLLRTLYAMAFVVEARDPYTGGHLWRVSQYSAKLALAAGFSRPDAATAALGGFLHDLGKVGVPDAILNKPGVLTDPEYAVIKTHPEVGVRVLVGHPLAPLVDSAVGGHHERMDGRGYPTGSAGESIPFVARIVSIADAFDAMTSSRPYRRGMPVEAALEQIAHGLGSQFDPALGKRFIGLGRGGELDAIVGHSEAGIPMRVCPVCGPVVALPRNRKAGETVCCRICGDLLRLEQDDGGLRLTLTGEKGTPAEQEPGIDHDLIGHLIEAAVPDLPLGRETEDSGWRARFGRWLKHSQ
jgi:hypothetical protein